MTHYQPGGAVLQGTLPALELSSISDSDTLQLQFPYVFFHSTGSGTVRRALHSIPHSVFCQGFAYISYIFTVCRPGFSPVRGRQSA